MTRDCTLVTRLIVAGGNGAEDIESHELSDLVFHG